jgi:hypothetical protein
LQSFKRDQYDKHALRDGTALVTMLSVAFMSLSAPLFAQDANSGTSARPTDPPSSAARQDGPQPPHKSIQRPFRRQRSGMTPPRLHDCTQ